MLKNAPRADAPETRLLDVARRLFCRDGIHATGVAKIIKEAGVARKTLYEKYGSKDNLLRAAFAAEAAMWFDWFDRDLAQRSDDPAAKILGLFDLLDAWFASGEFFGCLFINAVAEHDKNVGWVRELAVAHRDRIDERLSELAAAAGVRDVERTTQKISMLIDGAIVAAMVTKAPDIASIARSAAEDILRRRTSRGAGDNVNRRASRPRCASKSPL